MTRKPRLNGTARIGIMNRGEAAVRCIRAVKEWNALRGTSIATVAFYLDKEKDALFAKEADIAFPLSSLPGFAELTGNAYLSREFMLEALRAAGCTAVWVGWGFLSEDAPFVKMIEDAGLVFLGPSSEAMALLGDKIAAKELCERTGVPILEWSRGPVRSLNDARAVIAERIGYPCIVKAANAGGGRGIRFVKTAAELEPQFVSAREETIRITGNDVVFIEQLVERGRHLEVQVLADRHGTVRTFGVRDCSVQRRNQKIIEETPPARFTPERIREMEQAAARLIQASGYESAGTVEYLYDLERDRFYFMEVNTRLQVEHPITEQLYGIDLVKGQLAVASGESIESWNAVPRGAAIELRLNAEDPKRNFTPAPGKVTRFRMPSGPGLRVDSGIEQGNEIPSEFDSMIAKLIACAPTREEALARLDRALSELRIRIEGGTTNRAFLAELLACPEIRAGGVHTRFVEDWLANGRGNPPRDRHLAALTAAALIQYRAAEREELAYFKRQLISSGIPREIAPRSEREVGLRIDGRAVSFTVQSLGRETFRLTPDGASPYRVRFSEHDEERTLLLDGRPYHIQAVERGDTLQVEVDGVPYGIERESGGFVKSPSPAIVLAVRVSAGAQVKKGDVLLTLEAMKMEMIVTAPADGTVKELLVGVRDQVASGQPLVQLETGESSSAESARDAGALEIEVPAPTVESAFGLLRDEFLAIFLGYDRGPDAGNTLDRLTSFTGEHPEYRPALFETLLEAFEIYTSIEQLFSTSEIPVEGFAHPATCRELLAQFFRRSADKTKGLPEAFVESLERALAWYDRAAHGEDEEQFHLEAFYRIYASHAGLPLKQELLHASLFVCEEIAVPEDKRPRLADALDRITLLTQQERPSTADAAIHARYTLVDRLMIEDMEGRRRTKVSRILSLLGRTGQSGPVFETLMNNIVDAGDYVVPDLALIAVSQDTGRAETALTILGRRAVRDRFLTDGRLAGTGSPIRYEALTREGDAEFRTVIAAVPETGLAEALRSFGTDRTDTGHGIDTDAVLFVVAGQDTGTDKRERNGADTDAPAEPDGAILGTVAGAPLAVRELAVAVVRGRGPAAWYSFSCTPDGVWRENTELRGWNPVTYRELRMTRFSHFATTILYASESVRLLSASAAENPRDERLFALVEVPSTRPELDANNEIVRMVSLENVYMEAVYAMRAEQARRKRRLYWNRIIIHIRSPLATTLEQIRRYAQRLAARTVDLGMEKLVIYSRRPTASGGTEELELLFENISGTSFTLRGRVPSALPLMPMDEYVAKVVRARQRGTVYPYEILKMITRSGYPVSEVFPRGEFEEYDIIVDPTTGYQVFQSVKGRPYGSNTGNIVFGIITNYIPPHPSGVRRVIILSDTTADLGALAEPECRRVNAALDLAEHHGLPVEWIPISAGAKIEMNSGTENLDWTAATLRRIIEFTQNGGEINVIVAGIDVGAQSYWNAEATMLMHTRGLLIMTEDASMLLTGKKALDFSGSVSAENNVNIGGAERIMGPNGQAQMKVKTLYEAFTVLFRHYSLTWTRPGCVFPDRQPTSDSETRDVCVSPYRDSLGQGFATIGDIFSPALNPERKKPFEMRQVMRALVDEDSEPLERWLPMKDAETAIVWEARIGGYPIGLIGIESRSITRLGEVPHDGPEAWNGGTLFPLSSKKVARGINAMSGKLPLVILANLSGFDGSPESLRKLQLEYGAEIGRAIVNFKGPIVFVVTARYHGGAYVVFSKRLNPRFHSVALEGAYASVIGGAPAAAVVFPAQVAKAAAADPRVEEARKRLAADPSFTQKEFDELYRRVHREKETELAKRFDETHSVGRAKSVGSIDEIIPPSELRPYVIRRIELGIARYLSELETHAAV